VRAVLRLARELQARREKEEAADGVTISPVRDAATVDRAVETWALERLTALTSAARWLVLATAPYHAPTLKWVPWTSHHGNVPAKPASATSGPRAADQRDTSKVSVFASTLKLLPPWDLDAPPPPLDKDALFRDLVDVGLVNPPPCRTVQQPVGTASADDDANLPETQRTSLPPWRMWRAIDMPNEPAASSPKSLSFSPPSPPLAVDDALCAAILQFIEHPRSLRAVAQAKVAAALRAVAFDLFRMALATASGHGGRQLVLQALEAKWMIQALPSGAGAATSSSVDGKAPPPVEHPLAGLDLIPAKPALASFYDLFALIASALDFRRPPTADSDVLAAVAAGRRAEAARERVVLVDPVGTAAQALAAVSMAAGMRTGALQYAEPGRPPAAVSAHFKPMVVTSGAAALDDTAPRQQLWLYTMVGLAGASNIFPPVLVPRAPVEWLVQMPEVGNTGTQRTPPNS